MAGCHTYEDLSFVTGDTNRELTPADNIGGPARGGFIRNDGVGSIGVHLKCVNSDDYSNQFTLKNGETLTLDGLGTTKIKLVWIADSSYRIFVSK